MMKRSVGCVIVLVSALTNVAHPSSPKDAPVSRMDTYIDSLMSRMTLREKIGQLNLVPPGGEFATGEEVKSNIWELCRKGELGAVLNLADARRIRNAQKFAVEETRLGIPLFFGIDVIHGFRTIYPIPLAQACSWDMKGIEQCARYAAEEVSSEGVNWTFSPMVDVSLDARWGRIMEGSGEDPFLGSRIAEAMVRGYQGDMSKADNIMACVKHYALYGASEAGRDYNTVDMSRLRMYNQYFPPYKAAVKAGAMSVMTSFNIVDGEHATANRWLLDDVLRNQFGFGGFVVTDYGSIGEMTNHGFGDLKNNSARALKAGTDLDMCSLGFINTLEQSVSDGLVSEADIDKACRRILEAKFRMGLFDDPYKYCSKSPEEVDSIIFNRRFRDLSRKMAAETFVLLKNEQVSGKPLLPLGRTGRIALIGPLADARENLTGSWIWPLPEHCKYKSLREAMEENLKGKAKLLYAQGCNLCSDPQLQNDVQASYIPRGDNDIMNQEALRIARQADIIVCAMGEGKDFTGEDHSMVNISMPDTQLDLLKKLKETGKPIILINFSGRPTVMNWEKENIPAILNVWFPGTEGADAICDVIFGDKSPCGRLTVSMPQHVGQEPLYYNQLPTGRPVGEGADKFVLWKSNYLDVRNDALFPFGYGLSYTTYDYGEMTVDTDKDDVIVSVDVTNSGDCDGYEVVQCYIRDIACRYSRPVKELKGFERVFLKKGETKRVSIRLSKEDLSFYDSEGNLIFEPGEFDIMIGANSRDLQSQRILME